jgi:hypothetical protein
VPRPSKHGAGDRPWTPREWMPVLDVHPTALRPDALPGYAWIQFPDRTREVSRGYLEFWYDPPGWTLTDEELSLLRRIAAAEAPVMFQAEGVTVPARTSPSTIAWMCCGTCGKQAGSSSRCGSRSPATAGAGPLYGIGARSP